MRLSSLLLLLGFPSLSLALKVLIYQMAFSPSHMPFSGSLADTLLDSGHTVDKLILVYNSKVTNNGTKRLRKVYRVDDVDCSFLQQSFIVDPFNFRRLSRNDLGFRKCRQMFCHKLINDHSLINEIITEKYDVLLGSSFDYCLFALRILTKIPVLNAYNALGQDGNSPHFLGIPAPSSFVPQVLEGVLPLAERTFFDRLRSIIYAADFIVDYEGLGKEELEVMRQRIPNLPSLSQLFGSISYVFVNSNEMIDYSQPISSKIKYVGGITLKTKPSPLSEEYEKILSLGSTVLFSWGSLIRSSVIPLSIKREFLKAFREFPDYQFIWKLDTDDPIRLELKEFPNIHPTDWLDQVSLLNDKRVSAFITHLGMNSYLETAFAGKPAVAIPIFVDQHYNTGCAIRNGIGIFLDKFELRSDIIVKALDTVLNDDKMAKRSKEIASILSDSNWSPKAEFIRFMELSARHPVIAELLQLDSAEMSLWEYFCLDVLAFLLLLATILNTWATKCDGRLVFTDAPLHMDVEHVYFPLMGTRDHSWEKIRRVFRYINDTVINQYDWFLRADDDAYVIVDNARSLAANYDPKKPLVLGFRWGFVEPRGYIDGGVYILSREAMTTFNRLMIDNTMCPDGHIAEEDQEISRCMAKVGIYPTDTRDEKGRERFHHFHVDEFKDIWLTEFIKQNAFYGFKNFPKGISDSSVSFHHLSPYEMRIVDYLVNKLHIGNPLAALDSVRRPAFLDYFSRSPK